MGLATPGRRQRRRRACPAHAGVASGYHACGRDPPGREAPRSAASNEAGVSCSVLASPLGAGGRVSLLGTSCGPGGALGGGTWAPRVVAA